MIEVYCIKAHPANVPRMLNAMGKSLDYYARNFGLYPHKQARVIETRPGRDVRPVLSRNTHVLRSSGFHRYLNHPDDVATVFYRVAHEMAHQW
jgi:ABC-2 type transport system permease protein